MTIIADAYDQPRFNLIKFFRDELANRPGRLKAAIRIAVTCTFAMALAMVYQIPLPAYVTYLVLLLSRSEAASTVVAAAGGFVASNIALALSFLFYLIDADEPALRLPVMAFCAFIGMFLSRVTKLGPIIFLASYVLVFSQTLIDEVPNFEALTRLLLWLWVVVTIPVVATVLVNLLFGVNPRKAARQTAAQLMEGLEHGLRSGDTKVLEAHKETIIRLSELRHNASMFDHNLRASSALDARLIDALAELISIIPMLPNTIPLEVRRTMANALENCRKAFVTESVAADPLPFTQEGVINALPLKAVPPVLAIMGILDRLAHGIDDRKTAKETPLPKTEKSFFVADAFTNPDYARFALKAAIAIMASYLIYSLLDWPGISTALTTCFFVALGSSGETIHKLTLRLSGALVGGLLGGICIVWLVPALTDIGQLGVLIFLVSLAGAWVAASSERLSYAGMQFAFAFFLTVLHGYAPTDDLTAPRDRLVGILLGNILITVIFTTLWPISAAYKAKAAVASALRTFGQLLGSEENANPTGLAARQALSEALRFCGVAIFEGENKRDKILSQLSSPVLDRLAGAVFILTEQKPRVQEIDRVQFAAWFASAADYIQGKKSNVALNLPNEMGTQSNTDTAKLLLRTEIENAIATFK